MEGRNLFGVGGGGGEGKDERPRREMRGLWKCAQRPGTEVSEGLCMK